MSDWPDTTDESKKRWEQNAGCYDERMGDSGNRHFIELVIPDTDRFLSAKAGEKILDIACGNGIYSRKLAGIGANVTAFDYSENMIMHARKRSADYIEKIDFRVIIN